MAIQAPDPHERDWILGLIHAHTTDAMCILSELLRVALRDGACSANDVQTIPAARGVTGAVMKVLKELGLEHTDEKIKDIRPGKRGKVSVWRLVDRSKVETFMEYQLQYIHVLMHEPLPDAKHSNNNAEK